jgi:hypothetical protein
MRREERAELATRKVLLESFERSRVANSMLIPAVWRWQAVESDFYRIAVELREKLGPFLLGTISQVGVAAGEHRLSVDVTAVPR